MSGLVALNDHILIKPDEVKKQTEGGIVLPDTAKERPISGIVIISENNELVGKRVYYPNYCIAEMPYNNSIHHILKITDIWFSENI